MKILTWNLKRLEMRKDQLILEKLLEMDADILVLTETATAIKLSNYHCIATQCLASGFDGIPYKEGENRVSIWTRYTAELSHATYDDYTSVCVDLETPLGLLTVYATIIGVFANRQPRFDNDLYGQLQDFKRIFPERQVCLAGDLNVSFTGRAYPSHKARAALVKSFEQLGLTNTTADIIDNVDHIVLSDALLYNRQTKIETWNHDKQLSDHIGHCLTIADYL